VADTTRRVRVPDLREKKQRGEKIVVLTAYDFAMAQILDRAGVDVILVGDSLANVVLGYETTLPVTLDTMVHHSAAVSRGARRALVVADMPFLAAQVSLPEAVRNAGRLISEGGAAAVKIEGGRPVLEAVRRLVEIGIPVMGHLGLLPQSVHQLGGYGRQARSEEEAAELLEQARALEQAGVFSLVLESIPAELARTVSAELAIPTIGIGAGPHCDGQVLVCYDMLGLSQGPVPPFVRRYADLSAAIFEAVSQYAGDVRSGRFPAPDKEPR
jgi:3-methyl-2-oxobutanoate hydroxymethyltransferase